MDGLSEVTLQGLMIAVIILIIFTKLIEIVKFFAKGNGVEHTVLPQSEMCKEHHNQLMSIIKAHRKWTNQAMRDAFKILRENQTIIKDFSQRENINAIKYFKILKEVHKKITE